MDTLPCFATTSLMPSAFMSRIAAEAEKSELSIWLVIRLW